MADADYGYVGAGRNRISLYKGKQCILKNIPEEEAVEQLIKLIKDNGDWQDAWTQSSENGYCAKTFQTKAVLFNKIKKLKIWATL